MDGWVVGGKGLQGGRLGGYAEELGRVKSKSRGEVEGQLYISTVDERVKSCHNGKNKNFCSNIHTLWIRSTKPSAGFCGTEFVEIASETVYPGHMQM